MANKTVQPRQPTREGQVLKREDERIRERTEAVILDGSLTKLETIPATSDKKIKHGLGRKPTGYFFCRLRASGAISDQIRESKDMDENFITLRNDSATEVKVQLWVF